MFQKLFFLFFVVITTAQPVIYDDFNLDVKTYGHSGTIDQPRSNAERHAIEEVIAQWVADGPLGRGSGTITVSSGGRGPRARLDSQGAYNHQGRRFERYAVQIDSRTFASVHLEAGVNSDARLIREAFRESMAHQTLVFITGEGTRIENNSVRSKLIHLLRRLIVVWAADQATKNLFNMFNKQ